MSTGYLGRVGFFCAYTPLPLIDAAGFVPFRILPLGDAPDQAGLLLHDNMCPHVKRALDRALAGDLPDLCGVVFMNSCDAMRRLADAWLEARPRERGVLLDLPVTADERAVAYMGSELARLAECLSAWGGRRPAAEAVVASARRYGELAEGLAELVGRAARGELPGGRRALQELLNRSVTEPPEDSLAEVRRLVAAPRAEGPAVSGVPVYVFGNVMPDPEAFDLLEGCGVQVVGDDLCTGARQIVPFALDGADEDVMRALGRALLERPRCARTLEPAEPSLLGREVAARARAAGAQGVIAHVIKFCDPYLARMPAVRAALADAGLPLLVLEGDCTLRSLGQHRTRIEAFVEMLGGSPP